MLKLDRLDAFDNKHNGDRCHTDGDGAERQQNFNGGVGCPAVVSPGREIAGTPIAEPLSVAVAAIMSNAGQDGRDRNGDERKAADHRQQPVNIAAAGKTPDRDREPGRCADQRPINDKDEVRLKPDGCDAALVRSWRPPEDVEGRPDWSLDSFDMVRRVAKAMRSNVARRPGTNCCDVSGE
jgi:hypothetical protein